MHRVTYSLGLSLDGYVEDPDGTIDWAAPSPEVFDVARGELAWVGVHLMGRRLYETMLYWENAEQEQDLDEAETDWAVNWRALPKVVFSRTLTEVRGSNTRLATDDLATEIARLKAEPGDGDIAIGGARLASHAIDLGLLDEYRMRVHPILLGGGLPFFPPHRRRVPLELLESRTLDGGVQYLRYQVAH